MNDDKKDFYTLNWLIADMVALAVAFVVAMILAALAVWGVLALLGYEGQQSGWATVAILVAFIATMVAATAGLLALYDEIVACRFGRERGPLLRAIS